MTSKSADWGEGDWNSDGLFDQRDVVAVLEAGTYLRGVVVEDLSSLIANVPALPDRFGPPIVISNDEQLYTAVADQVARDAITEATELSRQTLLMYSWSGSGGDRLVAEPSVVAGRTHIEFRFQFGLTEELHPHGVLLAIPTDVDWHISVEEADIRKDEASFEFVAEASRLVVSGGIGGGTVENEIDGSFRLTWNGDGTASLSRVETKLELDTILNLSNLYGLQIGRSILAFSGWDNLGSSVVKVQIYEHNESSTVTGRSIPPFCCDFFQYEIDAVVTRSAAWPRVDT